MWGSTSITTLSQAPYFENASHLGALSYMQKANLIFSIEVASNSLGKTFVCVDRSIPNLEQYLK
jgi:hypothetical protein